MVISNYGISKGWLFQFVKPIKVSHRSPALLYLDDLTNVVQEMRGALARPTTKQRAVEKKYWAFTNGDQNHYCFVDFISFDH